MFIFNTKFPFTDRDMSAKSLGWHQMMEEEKVVFAERGRKKKDWGTNEGLNGVFPNGLFGTKLAKINNDFCNMII